MVFGVEGEAMLSEMNERVVVCDRTSIDARDGRPARWRRMAPYSCLSDIATNTDRHAAVAAVYSRVVG
jgi:carbamoylphosphate synthase large subunit